jgi:hypothetical protein
LIVSGIAAFGATAVAATGLPRRNSSANGMARAATMVKSPNALM